MYSIDSVMLAAQADSVWNFSGTAVGGFTIDFTVDGVVLQIVTFAGQTGAQVAQAVANEINGNETLEDAGIFAEADGAPMSTNGSVSNSVISDPGISHGAPAVPAFSDSGYVVLILVLITLGGWRLLAARRIAQ